MDLSNCPKPAKHKHHTKLPERQCPPSPLRSLPGPDLELIPVPQVLIKYLPAPGGFAAPCGGNFYAQTLQEPGYVYGLGGSGGYPSRVNSAPEIDPGSAVVALTVLAISLIVIGDRSHKGD